MNVIGLKKNIQAIERVKKAEMLDSCEPRLSMRRQCELLGYNRSNLYYMPHPRLCDIREYREAVMGRLDYWNTLEPAWGIKTLVPLLRDEGFAVSPDLIRELRREMGLETIYPKENTSKSSKNARKMPYLLGYLRKHDMIWLPNLVWAVDLTYIKMSRTHMYLIAIIDWFSRFIVGWELADTLETAPVLDCVKRAVERYGIPAILNSDQGSQFTSDSYMSYLWKNGIRQSMDGKGRWIDNVIIERWFRSLKIENIYVNEYISPRTLNLGIEEYVERYNYIRPHQSLCDKTPAWIFESSFGNKDKERNYGVVREVRSNNTTFHY